MKKKGGVIFGSYRLSESSGESVKGGLVKEFKRRRFYKKPST